MSAGSQPGKGSAQAGTGKPASDGPASGNAAGQNGIGSAATSKQSGVGGGSSRPGTSAARSTPAHPGERPVAGSSQKPGGSDRPTQSSGDPGQNGAVQKGAVPGGPPPGSPSPSRSGSETTRPIGLSGGAPGNAAASGPAASSQPRTPPRPVPPSPGPGSPVGPGSLATREAPQSGRPSGDSKSSKRRAHLVLSRVEPWSVTKFSFVISLVAFVVLFIAIAVLYGLLAALGVFDALTQTLRDLTTSGNAQATFDPASWFSASRVLGYTALIGALNVILITALATVGAVLYNLSADLVGGVEVTLSEGE